MLIAAPPGAMVWPAALIVWGPGYASSGHAHHCVQLVMAMQGTLRARRGPADEWLRCGAVLVKPDARHEIEAQGATVLIAFVEAESELGAALSARLRQDIGPVGARVLARWRKALGDGALLTAERAEAWVCRELLRGRKAPVIHPGVRRVLRFLREQLCTQKALSLENLARRAGLSRSRFMHVFTESLGVPLRPYILWLRLQRAGCELMQGASATEAAHNAGFADSAHLARTFRRMLGTTPTELARRKQSTREAFVQ